MGFRCRKQKPPRFPPRTPNCPKPCSPVPQRGSTFFIPDPIGEIIIIMVVYSACQGTPNRSATTCNHFPKQEPKQSPPPKRRHSSTEAQGDTSADKDSPVASQEGPSSSKIGNMVDWFSSQSPSHADTFCRDSSLVKEVRARYFTTHPWDWAHGNMDNLSEIFWELAQGTGLLGKSIHKLQWS